MLKLLLKKYYFYLNYVNRNLLLRSIIINKFSNRN